MCPFALWNVGTRQFFQLNGDCQCATSTVARTQYAGSISDVPSKLIRRLWRSARQSLGRAVLSEARVLAP